MIFETTGALIELERIGEACLVIIISLPRIAAWIATFVQWCLGVEPTLRFTYQFRNAHRPCSPQTALA